MTDTVTEFVAADGQGGLLQQLTKTVLESALEGEITDPLGYDKHDPAGKDGGNCRNGTWSKTVLTDIGPVEIDVPRERLPAACRINRASWYTSGLDDLRVAQEALSYGSTRSG